jgi:hypothetical protein
MGHTIFCFLGHSEGEKHFEDQRAFRMSRPRFGATLTLMQSKYFLLLLLVLAKPCAAQLCMPEQKPQPNSPYAYIRAEIKALQWIRSGLTESEKLQPVPHGSDPEWMHRAVIRYTVVNTVTDDYSCALAMLEPYKDSKNESIRASVEGLLEAIAMSKKVNALFLEMMESTEQAKKPEDINQMAIAKGLADLTSLQKDIHKMAMVSVKLSTFGIVRLEGDDDNAKPVAFTISPTQRATLLAEVRRLAKNNGRNTYVDLCAEILLSTLTKQLPTSVQ